VEARIPENPSSFRACSVNFPTCYLVRIKTAPLKLRFKTFKIKKFKLNILIYQNIKIKSRAQQITLKPDIIEVKKLLANVSLFTLKNSLIIHEENTKEIMGVKESVYVIQKSC
jgi:hypothetical protein